MHRLTSFLIALLLSLTGCSHQKQPTVSDGAPLQPVDVSSIPDAIPRVEPITRAGNPPTYVVLGKRYQIMKNGKGYREKGIASWYGTKFHGRKTSNGERYDMYAMTAAHKTLPIPGYLKVTNLRNNRSIIVRVNDRGPFHQNRIIDLSYAAAAKLDILRSGTGFVEISTIDPTIPQTISVKTSTQQQAQNEIYLQVGAFRQHSNALKLSRKISSNRITGARIQTDNEKQIPVYRVRVGPINSTEEADKLAKKLAQLGITESRLITRPKQKKPAY